MIASAITAANMKIKLVIADTKGPDTGANIVRHADAGKQKQEDDERKSFMVSHASDEIVDALKKRTKYGFDGACRRRITCSSANWR